jgi:hypothetical protein
MDGWGNDEKKKKEKMLRTGSILWSFWNQGGYFFFPSSVAIAVGKLTKKMANGKSSL